jgi:16S rRNA (cytidine1402-2'-O)-methyltransferase
MPQISDPGFELSRAAAVAEVMQTCAPGPSAILTALVLAGLPTDAFHFAGFLPNATAARRTALQGLASIRATLAFYESPKRIGATLKDAALVLGDERQAVVCRELTKKFEEIRRGTLGELREFYANHSAKGEIVLLVDRGDLSTVSELDLEVALKAARETMSMRDAVDAVSVAHGTPRRQVYQMALALEKDQE